MSLKFLAKKPWHPTKLKVRRVCTPPVMCCSGTGTGGGRVCGLGPDLTHAEVTRGLGTFPTGHPPPGRLHPSWRGDRLHLQWFSPNRARGGAGGSGWGLSRLAASSPFVRVFVGKRLAGAPSSPPRSCRMRRKSGLRRRR